MRRWTVQDHRAGRLAMAGAVIVLILGPVGGTSTASDSGGHLAYLVDATNFARHNARSITDSTASEARAVEISADGWIWRWALVPDASGVVVQGKASECPTPTRMVVSLGREIVIDSRLGEEWEQHTAVIDQKAGWKVLAVWAVADPPPQGSCTPGIVVDAMALTSDRRINDASPTSVCQATDGGGFLFAPPPPGYSTTWLGSAPGYYEIAGPSGEFAGKPPVGVMMLIHGGSWFISGPSGVHSIRGLAEAWRARGWSVVSVTSDDACGQWLEDTLWFYDRIRSAASPNLPVCVTGRSSGGHLALLVAAERPDVDCVVADGAPTDLLAIEDQARSDQAAGAALIPGFAAAAFGAGSLESMSPRHQVDRIQARTLISVAKSDPLIPTAQATDIAAALAEAHPETDHKSLVLEPGTTWWVHSKVSLTTLVEHGWASWQTALGR